MKWQEAGCQAATRDSEISYYKIAKTNHPSMLKETRKDLEDSVRKTMQHKYFGPPAKLSVYPPGFSPRKDVGYLFEEEGKIDRMKRKLYEHNPFETRFTSKMHNYA